MTLLLDLLNCKCEEPRAPSSGSVERGQLLEHPLVEPELNVSVSCILETHICVLSVGHHHQLSLRHRRFSSAPQTGRPATEASHLNETIDEALLKKWLLLGSGGLRAAPFVTI